jgi:hypothetical protein
MNSQSLDVGRSSMNSRIIEPAQYLAEADEKSNLPKIKSALRDFPSNNCSRVTERQTCKICIVG